MVYSGNCWCFSEGEVALRYVNGMFHAEGKPLRSPADSKRKTVKKKKHTDRQTHYFTFFSASAPLNKQTDIQ